MAQALWGRSPGCGLPGCSASQAGLSSSFPFSSSAKRHRSVPGDAGTSCRETKAMAKASAFSSFQDEPLPPHPMASSWCPRQGHSLTPTFKVHTHTQSSPGAAGSGTCIPGLGAHPASVPRGDLGHAPGSHTSAPHQPLTSLRHQLQAVFNMLRHAHRYCSAALGLAVSLL